MSAIENHTLLHLNKSWIQSILMRWQSTVDLLTSWKGLRVYRVPLNILFVFSCLCCCYGNIMNCIELINIQAYVRNPSKVYRRLKLQKKFCLHCSMRRMNTQGSTWNDSIDEQPPYCVEVEGLNPLWYCETQNH